MAFGDGVTSSGDYSHAEGGNTLSIGYGSHSEGSGTTSIGYYSHSEGYDNISGFKAFSGISANTIVDGVIILTGGTDYTSEFTSSDKVVYVDQFNYLHIESYSSISYSSPNFQINLTNTSINSSAYYIVDIDNLNSISATTYFGEFTHSEGGNRKSGGNLSLGEGSHSEGSDNISIGEASHSEGLRTISVGEYSHSEGSETTSIGGGSHSEGKGTQSIGSYSHAEGRETTSNGDYSHTEGYGTISNGDYQHTLGMFNLTGNTTLGALIIGNGTDNSNRSNLLFAGGNEVIIPAKNSVGIGTNSINPSSILHLESNEQGFLPPRMSATDAESITAVEGLMVYITGGTGAYITSKGWWGYTGNTFVDWAKIGP